MLCLQLYNCTEKSEQGMTPQQVLQVQTYHCELPAHIQGAVETAGPCALPEARK
jgi:hypothetical protein